jgi:hypothetical protein
MLPQEEIQNPRERRKTAQMLYPIAGNKSNKVQKQYNTISYTF